MKFIEKATTPKGVEIQLEDWSDHNTEQYPDLHGLVIATYPFAARTSKNGWIKGGEQFRLHIAMNCYADYTNDDVNADFEALKSGDKTLEDLAPHFWNGKKDMWCLGMSVEY